MSLQTLLQGILGLKEELRLPLITDRPRLERSRKTVLFGATNPRPCGNLPPWQAAGKGSLQPCSLLAAIQECYSPARALLTSEGPFTFQRDRISSESGGGEFHRWRRNLAFPAAWYGMVWHGMAWHSIAWHGMRRWIAGL